MSNLADRVDWDQIRYGSLSAVALTRDQANAHIVEHHRHHGRVTGHRFIVGAEVDGKLVGVAVVGRPRARLINQYKFVEVSRLCADGERNVCSFLYSRCSRIAKELGFRGVFTAILETEHGGSLLAAGWEYAYTTVGGSQDRPSRRRVDKSPTLPKKIYAPKWCLMAVKGLNLVQALAADKRRSTHDPTGGTKR